VEEKKTGKTTDFRSAKVELPDSSSCSSAPFVVSSVADEAEVSLEGLIENAGKSRREN